MDLFTITCTTCKSRLKVREESAIGQILGCPKCGGMVMVKPPEGWKKGQPLPEPKPELAPAITTVVEVRRPDETLGESHFDVVDDLLSDAPPKVRTPPVTVTPDAPGLARPRFVGAPPHAPLASPLAGEGQGRGAAIDQATESASASQAAKPPPPGEANADQPPPPDWSPPRPWRYWAMMAGSVVAGIVLALAVVVGMIQFFRDDPQTIAQAGSNPPALAPATAVPKVNPTAASLPKSPVSTPEVDPVSPAPVTPNVDPAVSMPPVAPAPMPAVEQDPLGLTEPPPVKPANPNDPLAKFDRLIGGDENPLPMAEEAPEPAPAVPVDPATMPPDKPVLPRPAPRAVNVTARLADALPAIETSGTPLVDFLQFMSDLSTIPITLDPEGLTFVRTTAETPVVIAGDGSRDTTVGGALSAGLKPLGLEYKVADDQLVVGLYEPAELPLLNYPVKDLATDEAQMAELAEVLQAVTEPGSWEASGGHGTLTVDAAKAKLAICQSWKVHSQLLIACEKLRTARKLPHATTAKYDAALYKLDTRLARARARLETPISLNFSQPTLVGQILERLGKAGGVRILVDWRDIAAAGWNPDGEATLIADKQPLAAALDALLTPMDLTWRVIDGQTIQVLTPDSLAARHELEFYTAGDLLGEDPTGDALLTRLRTALGEAHFREAGGPGDLRYDPAGKCLLSNLPQPKQRELEALLAKWRSELAK